MKIIDEAIIEVIKGMTIKDIISLVFCACGIIAAAELACLLWLII